MGESYDAYASAHKQAEACYEKDIAEGVDPYLPVLDDILGDSTKKEKKSVIREIPLSSVVGTKTQGRTNAFASNFMPLLDINSEFADKWMSLYTSQLEEGIRDPIKVYELFGKYYVQEGNKRVSVLKYCEAPTIMADVRELVIDTKDLPEAEAKLYQKYQEFKKAVMLDDIIMSSPENYAKLMKILKVDEEHPLDANVKSDLKSLFVTFDTVLDKSGVKKAILDGTLNDKDIKTIGDAFLQYLTAYGFTPDTVIPQSEMAKELNKLFTVSANNGSYLMTDTEGSQKKKSVISSLFTGPLKVAFINAKDGESSTWTAEHQEAIEELKKDMGDEVDITVYNNANTEEEITDALNKAIKDGNEVIFTTSPIMLQKSNQYAAKYPKLKILNCSLTLDTGLLRTYWAREYEVQFLLGLLAGVLTKTDRIGYLAGYPINGSVANINAFALGVEMTNPEAKIYLDWTTTRESTLKNEPLNTDILFIEGNKFDPNLLQDRKYGLFDVGSGKFFNLATIKTHWKVFYEKIIKSILNKSWYNDQAKSNTESITYWWGLSNNLLELEFSDKLPMQTRRLARQFRDDMANMQFMPFEGTFEDQDHNIHDWTKGVFMPHLVTMDTLVSNVVGTIPKETQLVDEAQSIVELYGVPKAKETD